MGMDVGGNKGGVKSDINVTPLVDVVLVLLIIFLVTMPILMRQITIEIPRKLESDEIHAEPSQLITIELKSDNRVVFSEGPSEEMLNGIDEVPRKLLPALEKKSGDKVIFVDFDFAVPYERAVRLMDTIRSVGQNDKICPELFQDPAELKMKKSCIKVALVNKDAKREAEAAAGQ